MCVCSVPPIPSYHSPNSSFPFFFFHLCDCLICFYFLSTAAAVGQQTAGFPAAANPDAAAAAAAHPQPSEARSCRNTTWPSPHPGPAARYTLAQ